MNTILDFEISEKYKNKSQIARVVTENWVQKNMFCPHCGHENMKHFKNNRPVADFYCESCNNEYELKSKNGSIDGRINDGAYKKMIERITSDTNPDFFLMNYSFSQNKVVDFIILPKIFFTPEIIEKRKPLSITAKRAGWIGCNILLSNIPEQGKIYVIEGGRVLEKEQILQKVKASQNLKTENLESRGWLLDVLMCVNQMNEQFSLDDIYKFEEILSIKHPQNHNVLAKIRQQLQLLRDKGFIEFHGNGKYRKNLDLF